MAVQVNNKPVKFITSNGDATYVSATPITSLEEAINSVSSYSALDIIFSPLSSLKRKIPYVNVDTKKTDYKDGLIKELTPKNVIFNPPATIVFWEDGEKTVVKCGEGEVYDKEKGLAMAFCKRVWGNAGRFNNMFEKWCFGDEDIETKPTKSNNKITIGDAKIIIDCSDGCEVTYEETK